MMPQRSYVFHEHRPQLDHIFPKGLEGQDEKYKTLVDVLWNLQPQPQTLNNYKRAKSPRDFFRSAEGSKYFADYDFIPPLDSDLWNYPEGFLRYRTELMRSELLRLYGLEVEIAPP